MKTVGPEGGMTEGLVHVDDVTVIHICAGPPACLLQGDEAVPAMQAGCVWCRRITIDADGRESETGPGNA